MDQPQGETDMSYHQCSKKNSTNQPKLFNDNESTFDNIWPENPSMPQHFLHMEFPKGLGI